MVTYPYIILYLLPMVKIADRQHCMSDVLAVIREMHTARLPSVKEEWGPGDALSYSTFTKHFHSLIEFVFTLFCRVDPFSKKDWYDVKAPSMFAVRQIGKTLVTRTQGTSRVFVFACYVCWNAEVYVFNPT